MVQLSEKLFCLSCQYELDSPAFWKARQFALQMSCCEKANMAWWKKASERQRLGLKTRQTIFLLKTHGENTQNISWYTLPYWNMQKANSHLLQSINHWLEKKMFCLSCFAFLSQCGGNWILPSGTAAGSDCGCSSVDLILAPALAQNILLAPSLWKWASALLYCWQSKGKRTRAENKKTHICKMCPAFCLSVFVSRAYSTYPHSNLWCEGLIYKSKKMPILTWPRKCLLSWLQWRRS